MSIARESRITVQWEDLDRNKYLNYHMSLTKNEEYVSIYAYRLAEGEQKPTEYIKYRVPNEEVAQWVNRDPMFNGWSFNSLINFFVEELGVARWLNEFKPYM